jgi:hypothetical protein
VAEAKKPAHELMMTLLADLEAAGGSLVVQA